MSRRAVGAILLVIGLAGFLWATSQVSGYDSVEGALKTTFSKSERGKKDAYATGRWVALALGVAGLALAVLPDKR